VRDQIVLVGGYPPPYGGCSVHVQRLHRALQSDFRVAVIDVYGTRREGDDGSVLRCGLRPAGAFQALTALRCSDARIVHFHVSAMNAFVWAAWPLLASLNARARTIVTLHGGSLVAAFESGPAWRLALARRVLRRFERIIAVNGEQRRFVERLGVEAQRIAVVPAFLPPVAEESARVREVIASCQDCAGFILASGYGVRHYGFHLILDALERRRSQEPLALVLCAYTTYDERYIAELSTRRGVRCTIVRDLAPGEFAWLLQRCEAYVRATDRDGDAVAIREAAFFGKTVIASDCVERPAGTLLFRTGDADELSHALEARNRQGRPAAVRDTGRAGLEALLDVYRELLAA
jgi:glycogen synthase